MVKLGEAEDVEDGVVEVTVKDFKIVINVKGKEISRNKQQRLNLKIIERATPSKS